MAYLFIVALYAFVVYQRSRLLEVSMSAIKGVIMIFSSLQFQFIFLYARCFSDQNKSADPDLFLNQSQKPPKRSIKVEPEYVTCYDFQIRFLVI